MADENEMLMVPVHEDFIPKRRRGSIMRRFNDSMQGGLGPNEEYRVLMMSKVRGAIVHCRGCMLTRPSK